MPEADVRALIAHFEDETQPDYDYRNPTSVVMKVLKHEDRRVASIAYHYIRTEEELEAETLSNADAQSRIASLKVGERAELRRKSRFAHAVVLV